MKKHYFTLIFVVIFTLGCSAINQIKKEIDKSKKPEILMSTDGKCQLTVPGSWKTEKDLNDDATLQTSHRFDELYVIVIPNSKADFTEEMTLDSLTQALRADFSGNVPQAESTNPVRTFVNGNEARQFEMSGSVKGIKAKYIYTVVDAPNNYYQIISWTLASRYETNKTKLLEVISTFKESGGKQTESLPPPFNSNKTKSF